MSFILDALRKSETERQRQAGTGLVDAGHRPPAKRRSPWLPLLVVVLVANLVLVAWLWWREPAAPATVATASPAPVAAVPTASATPPAAGRSLAEIAGAEDAPGDYADVADLPAIEPAPVTETLEPPAAAAAAGEAPAAAATGTVRDDLPTAAQLVATGALAGPVLHLDLHVFSDDPAQRFVFINMRKYTEGMQLPEGSRLEEITRDGAIFSHDGQRFLLPRD